jgi:indole-3-glycerol phosphate synthase
VSETRDIADRLRNKWQSLRSGRNDHSLDDVSAAVAANTSRSIAEAMSEDTLAFVVEPRVTNSTNLGDVAAECEAGGAVALSVVLGPGDDSWSVETLAHARASCDLPLIVRDVIVDVEHITQLQIAGADGVMIPVSAFVDRDDLPEGQRLSDLAAHAARLGIEPVLTVSTQEELELTLEIESEFVLNIDNRDDDGTIDPERTLVLLADVPVGTPVISESVARADDVARLRRAGVDALLLDEGHLDAGPGASLALFSDLVGS